MTVFITNNLYTQLLSAIKERGGIRKATDANTAIMKGLIVCVKMLGNLAKRCTRSRHIRLTNIKMGIEINNPDSRRCVCADSCIVCLF